MFGRMTEDGVFTGKRSRGGLYWSGRSARALAAVRVRWQSAAGCELGALHIAGSRAHQRSCCRSNRALLFLAPRACLPIFQLKFFGPVVSVPSRHIKITSSLIRRVVLLQGV